MTTDLCFECSNKDSILCSICGIAKDGAREHFNQKPITNADRIRAMSDEELATNFWLFTCVHAFDSEVKCKDNGCKDCWLRWLREEYKSED